MPVAKTSTRAEQRAVREKMRRLGMSHRQVAFEFARRYGLRPRAAWRHARGWSLKEAAEQVNMHAAGAGLDPDGTASMTASHLCEYENWPGPGAQPVGRRPTPLVLTLLAAVYGATVDDLLDLADYERMPASAKVVLQRSLPEAPLATPADATKAGRGSAQDDVPSRSALPSAAHPPALPAVPGKWGPIGMVGGAGMPVLDLEEIQHLVMAFNDARRYADTAVAGYFARQLSACAARDGVAGPKETLPTALAISAAIERVARDATSRTRGELLAVGARSAEFAGWLYRDSAMPGVSGYWHDRAAEWAQVTGDRALQAYVMLKRSQVAWDERDARRMLMLAQAVDDAGWDLPARVRAEAAQQVARGLAMLGGEMRQIEAKLDEARGWFAEDQPSSSEDERSLASHYGSRLLAMQTAICYSEVGDPARALQIYQDVLVPGVFSRRDYAYFQVLAGATLASAGRPDEAAEAGREALGTALATGSMRTLNELRHLLDRLRPWPARPLVRALRDELAGVFRQGL